MSYERECSDSLSFVFVLHWSDKSHVFLSCSIILICCWLSNSMKCRVHCTVHWLISLSIPALNWEVIFKQYYFLFWLPYFSIAGGPILASPVDSSGFSRVVGVCLKFKHSWYILPQGKLRAVATSEYFIFWSQQSFRGQRVLSSLCHIGCQNYTIIVTLPLFLLHSTYII